MNANEHFFRIWYYLAQIDKILNVLGHKCMYNIELPKIFAIDLNEKHHQVVLLVRKVHCCVNQLYWLKENPL